ncbi:MAG: LysM peptidoglycan-binding domain-containing protein [Chlamydiota bacterium]
MSRRNLIVAVVAAHLCVLAVLVLMGGCALEKKEPKLTAAAPVQEVRAPEGEPESILEPKGMAEEKDLLVAREPEMVPANVEAAAAIETPAPPTPVPFVEEKAGAEMPAVPEIGTQPPMVAEAKAAPPGKPAGGTHTVAPGESLWKIARTYGVTVADLARENNLKTDTRVKAGQTLVIPAGAQKPVPPPAAVNAEIQAPPAVKAPQKPAAAGAERVSLPAAKPVRAPEKPAVRNPAPRIAEMKPATEKAAAPRAETKAPAGAVRRHVVKKGESLSLIAKHYGVSMKKIMGANRLKDAGKIRAGMVLTIPQ